MTLPRDVSRCAGRFGLHPDDPICPRRDTCARWIAMRDGDGQDKTGSWNTVPVASGLCRDGEDFLIAVDGASE